MIALITDFGLSDIYVGVMKSVIQGIAPGAVIVDITHSIAPQDIRAASFALRGALATFPSGTVALVVVDPGVGTPRLPIAVHSGNIWIVAPNNGIVTGISFDQAVELDKPDKHRPGPVSSTFHGRDIFAPAAAHLHEAQNLSEVGTPIDSSFVVSLDRSTVKRTDTTLTCEAQHIDRFGNIITNVTPDILSIWAGSDSELTISTGQISTLATRVKTYADGEDSKSLLLLSSSFGLIEIATNGASAAAQLGGVKPGQSLTIRRSA